MSSPGPISVVVPVYRSRQSLEELVTRLGDVLGHYDVPFEILLVDDGSPDDSWAVVEKLAAENRHVRGVALGRNYGQHNALLAGIRLARHPVVITIDDD